MWIILHRRLYYNIFYVKFLPACSELFHLWFYAHPLSWRTPVREWIFKKKKNTKCNYKMNNNHTVKYTRLQKKSVLPLWYSLVTAWHCIALLCVFFLKDEWLCTEAPCIVVWAAGKIISHYSAKLTRKFWKFSVSDESLPPSLYVSFHSPLGSQSLWNPDNSIIL